MQNLKTDNNTIYDNVIYKFSDTWPSEDFEAVLINNLPNYKKYTRKEIASTGKIPVIDQGSEEIAGYIDDETGKYAGDLPLIIFGDHTRNIKYIDFDFAVGADGTKLLKPKEQLIEKFFYYYLRSIFIPPSGYSRHYKYLKEIKVPIPDKLTQQRIINNLDNNLPKVQTQLKHLSKARKLVAKFRQAILFSAITGKLTEDWRTQNSTTNSYKDFALSNGEIIQIPSAWEEQKMGNFIVNIQSGKNFSCPEVPVKDDKVGLVKISAVTWGEFDERETKTVEDPNKIDEDLFINSGDFLISRANTIELVGASVIVHEIKHRIMISDKVWRVLFKNINKEYINYFLKSSIGRAEIENKATGNQQSMRNISQGNFSAINIPIPGGDEQEEIIRRLHQYLNVATQVERQIGKADTQVSKLTQAILIKIFRGK